MTGVILAAVNRKLVTVDRWVHGGVNKTQAGQIIVVPIDCQFWGVKACPLSRAQVDLHGYYGGATTNQQIWVI